MADGVLDLTDALVNVVLEGAVQRHARETQESLGDAASSYAQSIFLATPENFRTPRSAPGLSDVSPVPLDGVLVDRAVERLGPPTEWPGSEQLDEAARRAVAETAEGLLRSVLDVSVAAVEPPTPVSTAAFSHRSFSAPPTPRGAGTRLDRADLEEVIRKEARSAVSAWMASGAVAEAHSGLVVDDAASESAPSEAEVARQAVTAGYERERDEAQAALEEWQAVVAAVQERVKQLFAAAKNVRELPPLTAGALGKVPLAKAAVIALAQLEMRWSDVFARLTRAVSARLVAGTACLPLARTTALRADELTQVTDATAAMQQKYAAIAGDTKVGNNLTLAADLEAAEQLQAEAAQTRERTFAEALMARACAAAMWRLADKRKRRNALLEEDRQRAVAAEQRSTRGNRDDMMAQHLAEVVVEEVGLRAHQRYIQKQDDELHKAAYAALKRADDAKQLMIQLRSTLAARNAELGPLQQKLLGKENELLAVRERHEAALEDQRATNRNELEPYRKLVKDEQSKVVSLHRELDSLRSLMAVPKHEVSVKEEPSFQLEQADGTSVSLKFPPIRVPVPHASPKAAELSKDSTGDLLWAVKKEKAKLSRVGRGKLRALAEVYAPAAVDHLDESYGLPPDQARPQVAYRTLQPSTMSKTLPSLHKEGSVDQTLGHSRSSLGKSRGVTHVDGIPVRSERWVVASVQR